MNYISKMNQAFVEMNQNAFQIVTVQLLTLDPPEVAEAYKRLIELGYPKRIANELLVELVLSEITYCAKNKTSASKYRFLKSLHTLPYLPYKKEKPKNQPQ
ncbi:MAG: hypothetical protein WCH34_11840 [Bacteroidota bacterium]